MFSNSFSLAVINLAVISSASTLLIADVSAQSQQSGFNRQQCIQNLVKQGLKANQASVWCNYQEECVIESQKEGLPIDAAKTVCECTISEFRNKYTTAKFKELTQQINTNKKTAREFRDVGERCFEKILFE